MGILTVEETPIAGVTVVRTSPVGDARGRFTRLFCRDELAALRPGLDFTQINTSVTCARGTVRGMHFQHAPAAEAKLIRCIGGRVFDVALDLRAGSPTFLRWFAIELAADEEAQVFIPEGCAHGFQALDDDARMLYMHTRAWSPAHEGHVNPLDPRAGIRWPLPPQALSTRDRDAPLLGDHFAGLTP